MYSVTQWPDHSHCLIAVAPPIPPPPPMRTQHCSLFTAAIHEEIMLFQIFIYFSSLLYGNIMFPHLIYHIFCGFNIFL